MREWTLGNQRKLIFLTLSALSLMFGFECLVFKAQPLSALANEVLSEKADEIVVREHPKTGLPYVSIINPHKSRVVFAGDIKKYRRPDYTMLDPAVKPRDVQYDGPVSDRKKVYVLAGALAAGGVAGYAAMPVAAAGGGAATGAGAYAAGGAAVTAGILSTHWAMKYDDRPDDFMQVSISREIPMSNKE